MHQLQQEAKAQHSLLASKLFTSQCEATPLKSEITYISQPVLARRRHFESLPNLPMSDSALQLKTDEDGFQYISILPEAQGTVVSLRFCSFIFAQSLTPSLTEIMRYDGVTHFHLTGTPCFFFKGDVRCKNKGISFMPDSPLPGPPSKTPNPEKSWELDESKWRPRKNKVAWYLLHPWPGRNMSFIYFFQEETSRKCG